MTDIPSEEARQRLSDEFVEIAVDFFKKNDVPVAGALGLMTTTMAGCISNMMPKEDQETAINMILTALKGLLNKKMNLEEVREEVRKAGRTLQ